MALDLSALDGEEKKPVKSKEQAHAVANGKPLEIPLADVEEDPNQPRKEYSKQALEEMSASIQEKGVIQPISVRPHPDNPKKWIINFGSRRYRGSKLAKKKTIPAFIDEKSDDYGQVIENDQRENLTPMEMAIFIKKKLDEGVKHTVIAKKLSKPRSVITEYLALIDAPDCITDAYRSGMCTSPRTLYELRQLHTKYPEKVDEWYKGQEEITRKGVSHLSDMLKGKKGAKEDSVRHDEQKGASGGKGGAGAGNDPGGNKSSENDPSSKEPASSGGSSSGAGVASSKGQGGSNENALNCPNLVVTFEGRNASVRLNKKPSELGMIGILFEDGGEAEVEANQCQILHLIEA